MALSTFAYVTPEVLRWARESTGYSVQDAASKIGIRWWRLEAAEQGVDLLTLRQAEKAAAAYERPLATLFLPAPPYEEPQEAQFRRLPGAPRPPWPPDMQLLTRRVRERQAAAAELYDLLEESPRWQEAAHLFDGAEVASLPRLAREALGVSREEQVGWAESTTASQRGYASLRAWIDAVEALGVLVMQDGSMPVELMRGFASTHPTVPAIVVNSTDDPRARAFSVVHELGHLILAVSGVAVGRQTEQWCNQFAGEVLVPAGWLAEAFRAARGLTLLARVEEVAQRFSVTPLAAAVRVRRAELVSAREAEEVIAQIRERGEPQATGGGGNYYRNTIGRLGPGFVRLVFSALDNQALTYPTASTLLGNVKVNNFDTLRDHLSRRIETL